MQTNFLEVQGNEILKKEELVSNFTIQKKKKNQKVFNYLKPVLAKSKYTSKQGTKKYSISAQ